MRIPKPFSIAIPIILLSIGLGAQPVNWDQQLPTDPKVIIGTLNNGMRYYIRGNSEPRERAEFYIVHNVGAILEDDDQDGLAHFTEHMAFQGTKHFPKKGIINFMESVGVRFGHNINAFTAQDVTAYNLSNVPVVRESVIDSALLILHDWSRFITFKPEEIELERGVIREEWRTNRTASWRLQQAKMPYLFHGSKYAERDVIGEIDIINNFEHETLLRFYNQWYGPDLQALIIVGDFDPVMMEAKVIERFAQIPPRDNPIPRPIHEVPNHSEPLVGIYTDPEATRTTVEIVYKHPRDIQRTRNMGYLRQQLVNSLYSQMLSNRLNELVQTENPPFVFGYNYYGRLVRSKSIYALVAIARERESERALKTLLEESYRVYQHGFTGGELTRAKSDLLRSFENAYRERDKLKNDSFVEEYMSHFTENDAIPGIEFEYMFVTSVIPTIVLDEVNALSQKWITDENRVILISAPETEAQTIPSKEKILSLYNEVKASSLNAYEDNVSDEPLVEAPPKPGRVKKSSYIKDLDATEWVLTNGLRVIVKKTDFKADEIRLSAFSTGGHSLVKDADVPSALLVSAIASMSGLGSFTRVELDKKLAGKVVSVSPYLGEFEEGFTGSSSPDDLETMLQMVYLHFISPRFDETAYNAYMSRLQAILQNLSSSPNTIFNDSVSFILSGRHFRRRPMSISLLSEVNFETLSSIYRDRIKNASDFTFVLVGNFEPQLLKPLVETYLGSIPTIKRKETWRDNKVRFPSGQNQKTFAVPMKDPKSSCFIAYSSPAKYTRQNRLYLSTIEHILTNRYLETIREDQGGTYGVAVRTSISNAPKERVMVNMFFDTNMEKAPQLVGIIHDQMRDLMTKGPNETEMNNAREHLLKLRQEQVRENGFWVGVIKEYYQNRINLLTGFEGLVNTLTVESVRNAAREFFEEASTLEIIMQAEQ